VERPRAGSGNRTWDPVAAREIRPWSGHGAAAGGGRGSASASAAADIGGQRWRRGRGWVARAWRRWQPQRPIGLAGRFFCFFYSINRDGQKTVYENASLTVTFAQRRLALPASENQFQPHLKKSL